MSERDTTVRNTLYTEQFTFLSGANITHSAFLQDHLTSIQLTLSTTLVMTYSFSIYWEMCFLIDHIFSSFYRTSSLIFSVMTTNIFLKAPFWKFIAFLIMFPLPESKLEISEMLQRTISTPCIFPFFLYNFFHIIMYLY